MNHDNQPVFIEHGFVDTTEISLFIPFIENDPVLWSDEHRQRTRTAQRNTQNIAFTWIPILHRNEFSVFVNSALRATTLGASFGRIESKVLELIPGKVIRAGIVRMSPQSRIATHLDGTHFSWVETHRVHLPVITEPEVEFYYENENVRQHLKPNYLVEINNFIPHGVEHNGQQYRYHLMWDILPSTYSGDIPYTEHYDINRFYEERAMEIDVLSYYR